MIFEFRWFNGSQVDYVQRLRGIHSKSRAAIGSRLNESGLDDTEKKIDIEHIQRLGFGGTNCMPSCGSLRYCTIQ